MITRKQKAHRRTLLCSCFAREYQQVIVCASPIVQQMIAHPSKGQKWSDLDFVTGTIWKKSAPWNKHSQTGCADPTREWAFEHSCGKKNPWKSSNSCPSWNVQNMQDHRNLRRGCKYYPMNYLPRKSKTKQRLIMVHSPLSRTKVWFVDFLQATLPKHPFINTSIFSTCCLGSTKRFEQISRNWGLHAPTHPPFLVAEWFHPAELQRWHTSFRVSSVVQHPKNL